MRSPIRARTRTIGGLSTVASALVATLLALGTPPTANAQRQWDTKFTFDAFTESVRASVVFDDDGPGPHPPALYVGGAISRLPDGSEAWGVARWDGTTWSALPPLWYFNSRASVYSLAVFDEDGDGPGLPALFIGGQFNSQVKYVAAGYVDLTASQITKWDGTSYQPVGGVVEPFSDWVYSAELTGIAATAMAVHNDGSGPALFIGGNFRTAGGVFCNGIVKWDGTTWSELGAGVLAGNADNQYPRTIAVHDPDGPGGQPPQLYIGGNFWNASRPLIARWNGSSLSAVGPNLYSGQLAASIEQLVSYNGSLYARTSPINSAVNTNVLRWDGTSWTQPIAIGQDQATSLAVHNDGSGAALYVGMSNGTPAQIVRKWSGSTLQDIGTALSSTNGMLSASVLTYDLGAGPQLVSLGGRFQMRWTGTTWSAINQNGEGSLGSIGVLLHTDLDGPGGQPAALYAAGSGNYGSSNASDGGIGWVTKFDGQHWSYLGEAFSGGGFDGLRAPYTGGALETITHVKSGPAAGLYVCGRFDSAASYASPWPEEKVFHSVARWNGSAWQRVGADGVIAGVEFGYPPSSATMLDVAGTINDSVEYDPDGAGPLPPRLIVTGHFKTAGGVPASNIAQWDGTNWSPLGDGLDSVAYKLAVADLGAGPRLYVAGDFASAGGAPAAHIACWNGAAWTTLDSGLASPWEEIYDFYGQTRVAVYAMSPFTDAAGPGLVVSGNFCTAGAVVVQHVARWNGSAWSPMFAGVPLFHWTAVPYTQPGVPYNTVPFTGDYPSTYLFNNFFNWDDGSGMALYATTMPNEGTWYGNTNPPSLGRLLQLPVQIGKWTGTQWVRWTAPGAGFDRWPSTESIHLDSVATDGNGPNSSLYVSGGFRTVGGTPTGLPFPVTTGGVRSNNIAHWSPAEPSCRADFNGVDGIGVQDIFDFLNAWFAGSSAADMNGDGLSVQDIFDFLNAWFAGC
jgi:hypothetical protein